MIIYIIKIYIINLVSQQVEKYKYNSIVKIIQIKLTSPTSINKTKVYKKIITIIKR